MKNNKENYKVYKVKFKNIINNNNDFNVILDACKRSNEIITHVYQFLRLFILDKYNKNLSIPKIDKDFVKTCFKVLSKESAGPKLKGNNLTILTEFTEFYNKNYASLCFNKKFDSNNLSQIISYSCTDIITNIENNIILNFEKYINRFVNASFKDKIEEEISNIDTNLKSKKKKELYKELKILKQDLFSNNCSNLKYKEWFDKNRNNIFPNNFKDLSDLKVNPQQYLKHLIFLNSNIEKIGKAQFQFFPLRNDFNLKYIPIDSKIIIELLVKGNKNHYLSDITNLKNELWKKYFNLNHNIFRNKKEQKYSFDYMIYTDCVGTSIQFIENNKLILQNNKKINMKNARVEIKKLYKDKSENEINIIREKNKKNKEEKLIELKLKKQIKTKEYVKNLKEKKIIPEKEFKYLEELNETEIKKIKNYIVVDPGKRTILQMMNKDKKVLTYTNKQRKKEINSLKFTKEINNYRKKSGILKLEKAFENTCSKSCNLEKFKNYIKTKNKLYPELQKLYELSKCRQYKWYSFLNKKRSEDNIINKIKKTYGKDLTIFIGDWSTGSYQMKNFVSTPRIGLKRKLKKHFNLYDLNEFNTSKMNCYTEKITKNLKLKLLNKNYEKDLKKQNEQIEMNKNDKKTIKFKQVEKNPVRKLHSVLTYKMKNNRIGCINRDKNSCLNMLNIVSTWFKEKKRPEYLTRQPIRDFNLEF